jgi:hypothetical protein
LTSEWKFCYDSVWYPATVPGSIHTDLIKNNIIKDPIFGELTRTLYNGFQIVSGNIKSVLIKKI